MNSGIYHLPAITVWTIFLTSLSLDFSICKLEIMTIQNSEGYYKYYRMHIKYGSWEIITAQ